MVQCKFLPGDASLDCMLHHTRQRSQHHQAHDAFQQDSQARKQDKLVYNNIEVTQWFLNFTSLSYIAIWLITFLHVLNS